MAEVSLTINSRTYRVACQDGEEERLRALGAEIDREVARLATGQELAGDARLMLMAALIIADERNELKDRLGMLEREFARLKDQEGRADAVREDVETQLAGALQDAAQRIQRMAKRLEQKAEAPDGRSGDPSDTGRLPF